MAENLVIKLTVGERQLLNELSLKYGGSYEGVMRAGLYLLARKHKVSEEKLAEIAQGPVENVPPQTEAEKVSKHTPRKRTRKSPLPADPKPEPAHQA